MIGSVLKALKGKAKLLENADERKLPFEEELHRVMIHGILHLCGLEDKGEEAQKAMRSAEDDALKLLA